MTDHSWPTVAIIVVTWNQRDLTYDCLSSLAELDYPAEKLRLVVVDNASVDDTVTLISTSFPGVAVISNQENLGFVGGNNVGMNYILQEQVEYVVLLNNDTIVDRQMLRELISIAEGDINIGIVGPKIYYHYDPGAIWAAGATIDWSTGKVLRLLDGEQNDTPEDFVQDVDYVHGCAICVKRSVIEQIGLLDDRLFIYYEETDWCVRAKRAGWRIVYVPQSKIWHRVSAAMGTASPATEYYMSRNVLLFLWKHLSGWPRYRAIAWNILRSLLAAGAYTVKSHNGTRLPRRNARVLALRDALLGRWGKMGPDVERVCYPER